MIRYAFGALAIAIATAAQAGMPTDIVNRHMAAAGKGDVNALLADYADDAVVLQAGQAAQGKAAIRGVFERLFPARAPGAPATGALAGMKINRVWEEGNVGLVSWQAGTLTGTDEFLIRDGKIAVQAVFLGAPPPGQ